VTKQPARAWQRMLSGRRLDLLDPSPLDVEIEDIAHGLARVARWNGQTSGDHAFSVAQHSVLVSDLMAKLSPGIGRKMRLAGLLHDAPEYVVGDLISPFKAAVGMNYKGLERKLLSVIHIRFGLTPEPPEDMRRLIKKADTVSAHFEAVQLAGFAPGEAAKLFGRPPKALAVPSLVPLPTAAAEAQFLEYFKRLSS
jgi:uncharacterized protein